MRPNPYDLEFENRRLVVMQMYKSKCVMHADHFAITIHEEPPRSLNPQWKDQPWTWFPLCHHHHEEAHCTSRAEFEERLIAARNKNFPGLEARLHGDLG